MASNFHAVKVVDFVSIGFSSIYRNLMQNLGLLPNCSRFLAHHSGFAGLAKIGDSTESVDTSNQIQSSLMILASPVQA
jgi:hypothetical protein